MKILVWNLVRKEDIHLAKDKIIFSSNNNIELSEYKNYIELTNLLCYYDEPNLNGVLLPSEGALEKAQTLINMPVVAKYKVVDGKPDLGGHEAYIDPVTKEVAYDTSEIGTHTSIEIKDAEVEVKGEKKTLPCLFATQRLWTTRHKNTIKAVKALYDEGKLTSSWEVNVNSYEYNDGIKVLKDYTFDADCLLGSQHIPAYPCASVVDMASLKESQMMIAEAIEKDKEENEMAKESQKEHSALTIRDLREKLNKAICEQVPYWIYISFIMVDENYCLCDGDGLSDLEFYKVDYSISDGEVTVGEPTKIKLAVPVGNINQVLSERDNKIIENQKTISSLDSEVEKLKKYKDIVDKEEAEKEEAEKNRKIEELKTIAKTGGYISEKEISEDETIKKMISELDETGIKSLIVDRMLVKDKETSSNHTSEMSEYHTDIIDDDNKVSAFDVFMGSK